MEGLSGGALGPSALFGTTEILRIVVEGKGSSGFVEVTSGNTLREVRKLVEEQVAAAPAHFVFLLPDGIPVSRRQERTQSVSSCLPCVTLRAVEPKTGPAKVTVDGPDGRQLALWVPSQYTFRQLRGDCAQYWRVSPSSCALCDENNCLWPDSARVLSVLLDPKLKGGSRIRFVAKNAAAGRRGAVPSADGNPRGRHPRSGALEVDADDQKQEQQQQQQQRRREDPPAEGTVSVQAGGAAASTTEASTAQRNGVREAPQVAGGQAQEGVNASPASSAPRRRQSADPRAVAAAARQGADRAAREGDADANESELWRIFTRYASLGSAADPFHLTRRQFAQLVRDCSLIGHSFTHTDADLLYAAAVSARGGGDGGGGGGDERPPGERKGSTAGAQPSSSSSFSSSSSSPWRDTTAAASRVASYGLRWQSPGPSLASLSAASSTSSSTAPLAAGGSGFGADSGGATGPVYMTFSQFLDALTQLAWRTVGPRSSASRAATEALHRSLRAGTALECLPQRAAHEADRAAQRAGAAGSGPLAALGRLLRRLGTDQAPGPVEVTSVREAALREVEGVQEAAFYHLLTRHVLPKAVRWPDQSWKPPAGVAGRGTAALFRAVGPSLRELFLAYSPAGERRECVDVTQPPPGAGESAARGGWEPSITFYGWLAFLQDGGISELRVSRAIVAEAFLAAAQGSGVPAAGQGASLRASRGAGLAASEVGSEAEAGRGSDDTAASLAAEAAAQMAATRRGDTVEAAAGDARPDLDAGPALPLSTTLAPGAEAARSEAARSPVRLAFGQFLEGLSRVAVAAYAVGGNHPSADLLPGSSAQTRAAQHWQRRGASAETRAGQGQGAGAGGEGSPGFLSPREAADAEAGLCVYVLALLRHISRTFDVRGHERLAARRGVGTSETGRFLRACGGLSHRLLVLSQAVEAEELADMVEGGVGLGAEGRTGPRKEPHSRVSPAPSRAATQRQAWSPRGGGRSVDAAALPQPAVGRPYSRVGAGVGESAAAATRTGDDRFAARRAFGDLARAFASAPAAAPASEDCERESDGEWERGHSASWSLGRSPGGESDTHTTPSAPTGSRGRSMLVRAGSRLDRATELDAATEAGRAATAAATTGPTTAAGSDTAAPSSPRPPLAASTTDATGLNTPGGSPYSSKPLLRGVRRASVAGTPRRSSPASTAQREGGLAREVATGARGRRRASDAGAGRGSREAGGKVGSPAETADAHSGAASGRSATGAAPSTSGEGRLSKQGAPRAPVDTPGTSHDAAPTTAAATAPGQAQGGDSTSAAAAVLARQRLVQEEAVARVHEQIERALAASRGMHHTAVASVPPPARASGESGGARDTAATVRAVGAGSGSGSSGDESHGRGGHRWGAPVERKQHRTGGARGVGAALVGDADSDGADESTGGSVRGATGDAGVESSVDLVEVAEEEEEEEKEEEEADHPRGQGEGEGEEEGRGAAMPVGRAGHGAATASAPATVHSRAASAAALSSAPQTAATADSPSTAAAAAAAAAEETSFRNMRDVVIRGDVFMKHGRRGNPHRRFVWYDVAQDMVQWRKLRAGVTARAERGLSLSAVSHVQTGQETTVLRRGSVPADRASTLFSLVSADRTLDLEAEDASKRDLWVQAFRALLMRPAAARKRDQ